MTEPQADYITATDNYPVHNCRACGGKLGVVVKMDGRRALMTYSHGAPVKSFACIITCPQCGQDAEWKG